MAEKVAEAVKVLIVDDDEQMRSLLSMIVGSNEMLRVVGKAANGREAVESVALLKPDIVIMDLMMPFMDGDEATSLIKERFPRVSVVGFTAADDGAVDRLLEAGARPVVEKESLADLVSVLDVLKPDAAQWRGTRFHGNGNGNGR